VRVYDTFMLRDELDMLECHLVQYEESSVYRHILVEAPLTFTGRPKPLYYMENRERFAPWADRIVHLVDDELPAAADPWVRERHQRDFALRGLGGSSPEDVVIVADLDELLFPEVLKLTPSPFLGCVVRLLYGTVDREGHPGVMPVLARRGSVASLNQVREGREFYPRVEGAGWHLSWFGGPDVVRVKAESFSHTEAVPVVCGPSGIAEKMWSEGWTDPSGARAVDVEIDGAWPKWVWRSWDPAAKRRRPEGPAPASWFRPR
jgi:hypothetical protein